MKVLLIRPPIYSKSLRYPGGPRFGLPTSLLYLAAVLEREKIKVAIYDALIDFTWEEIKRDENGNYIIGPDWDSFTQKVLNFNPDIVGITNPFSDFANYAIRAAAEIKIANPKIVVVIGGPHATSSPEYFLLQGNSVDYVVRAEGEITFIKLIRALETGASVESISGISYRKDNQVHSNPPATFIDNLDDLPLPAYQKYFALVKAGFPSRYVFEYPGSEREVSIITSRGCPHNCIFCGNHLHMGRRWRFHSASYVLKHMELLISHYGVRHFHIEDDNIALNISRFEQILDGIKAKDWHITWDTPNGIRADGLTPDLLHKIKNSGCLYLIIGIESGNQFVLNNVIKKNLLLEDVNKTAKTCKKLRLDLHGFYVIGFPGESRIEIEDTFQFAKTLLWHYDVVPHISLARPLPGTKLYDICKNKGYLTEPLLPEIDKKYRGEIFPRVMIHTESFSPKLLEKWVAKFDRQVVLIILLKILIFLFSRPITLINIFKKFLRDKEQGVYSAGKRIFWGGLLFKFNYLNKNLR